MLPLTYSITLICAGLKFDFENPADTLHKVVLLLSSVVVLWLAFYLVSHIWLKSNLEYWNEVHDSLMCAS